MNRTNVTYRPLGEFIKLVDERNKDLKVKNLQGLSIEKKFIPSIANTIGTDMSTYRVVKPRQFAYGPVTSRNGDKVTVALYKGEESAIISQAYLVFEITDFNQLLPEYLMMWFLRPEFDRYARFHSHGSAREIFDWDELCATQIPVPPIEEQRRIVEQYNAVQRRIDIQTKLITKLQDTAQALYKKTFVDGIDKDHLPEGWRMGTILEFCKKMTSGGTPNRGCNEYWNNRDYRWLKTGEVHNNVVLDTEEYISQKGLEESSAKLIPQGSVTLAMYCANGVTGGQVAYLACDTTTNQACCNMICKTKFDSAFLYFHLIYFQSVIKRNANGAAQENLNQELIANQPILLFDDDSKKQPFEIILNQLVAAHKEISKLKELQTIILSKMGS